MKCPFCSFADTRVIDSRPAEDNNSIRRRRVCDECGKHHDIFRSGGGERIAKKWGVDCLFGFHKQDELIRILKSADLYVHTASVEIEAIACTEAIASGLVALICDSKKSATKAFAADDWVKFKKNDSKALSEKIDYLFENRDALARYQKLYEAAQCVSPLDVCMEKMEDMVKRVAAGKAEETE